MSSPSLPGDREQPIGQADRAAAEIEAEIFDHLATSAEKLTAAGASADEARRQTQEKFGDARAIGRRCWWIKQGDTLMLRGTLIGLIVALGLALVVVTIGGWQAQSRMSIQMSILSEQLKSLAERQSPAAPAEPPLEITGRVYAGAPEQPAAGVEVSISRVEDGEIVRRVTAGPGGAFRSGPLTAGDYTLHAKLQSVGWAQPQAIQSAPVYVYPGVEIPQVELDIAWHFGRIQIELSRPLPKVEVESKYTIESRLFVKVLTNRRRDYSWTVAFDTPPDWPTYVRYIQGPKAQNDEQGGAWFYEILSTEDLAQPGNTVFFSPRGELPEGQAAIIAAVLADVLPTGYEPKPTAIDLSNDPTPAMVGASNAWRMASSNISWFNGPESWQGTGPNNASDDFVWATRARGWTWLEHLRGGPDPKKPMPPDPLPLNIFDLKSEAKAPGWAPVPITRGQVTKVRIEIPDTIEKKLRELVDSNADPDKFAASLAPLSHPFFTEAKISAIGTTPLP
jgi:hypothetical protein